MGEFFKGWRRKIGIVTLVIALVFMAGWVRSYLVIDLLWLNSGTRKDEIRTFDGDVHIWVSKQMPRTTINGRRGWFYRCRSLKDYQGNDDDRHLKTIDGIPQWRLSCGGFAFGLNCYDAIGWQTSYAVIPYWSIVIPVTLLSAWLLLSKPRQKPAATKPDSLS